MPSCDRCGQTASRRLLYTWPGGKPAEWLCTPCISPLCEYCGERDAVLSLGTRDNWHACEECATTVPALRRKRRRVSLRGAP